MLLFASFSSSSEVTLERCLESARENYPLIMQYELLKASEDIELSDINKGWLPKISLSAQTTIQNVVPSFPSALTKMMQQMSAEMKGLGKFQYRIGADINQTIWDGGASRVQRETAKARTEAERARLDVDIYAIRQRVESIYFGILLLREQIEKTQSAAGVYEANIARMKSMLSNGVAMQSDVDMVEAQLLTLKQQLIEAESAEKGYRNMLSIFTGRDMTEEALANPETELPSNLSNNRPEMSLFKANEALNSLRRRALDVTLMPKIGFFAQTYYGYPGIDYFKAMTGREPTFNIIAGVRATWNIDAFYNKKNTLHKIDISDSEIETARASFLFNSSIQTAGEMEKIRGLEKVISDDARIIQLRRNVRTAAESQLRNGVIDATALITKINDETQASLNAAYHKIQRLQAIYNLKNSINR